jgi:hypothetical protein
MDGFGTAKPMASLSSSLLARKGAAKPAMRPQGLIDFHAPLEDLGWNDMGDAVQPLTPEVEPPVAAPVPPVIAAREALAREVQSVPVTVAPAALATIGKLAGERKSRAAFTLRLDADRHLRLRLASAVEGRSAQAIVTAALDRYLENLAEVDALAAQLRAGDGTR